MAIDFRCPHCGHQTSVAERYAGQTGPCAGCGQSVTIPAGGELSSPPPRAPSGGGKSVLVILAIVGVCALCAVGGLFALLFPAISSAREAARRAACSNNLRQIGLGLHNYSDQYRCFPPAYTVDAEGRPLHSWRVLLLPYMDQAALYERIRLDEPWDSPHNAALAQFMPLAFRCPSHEDDGSFHTHYLAIVGPDTPFTGVESVRISDIQDGLSNTIAVAETTESAHWMEPKDMSFEGMSFVINDPAGHAIGSAHPLGVNLLFCDDSVKFMAEDLPEETVRLLLLRNDGQLIDTTQF